MTHPKFTTMMVMDGIKSTAVKVGNFVTAAETAVDGEFEKPAEQATELAHIEAPLVSDEHQEGDQH